MKHIGFRMNSYDDFKKTGSVEKLVYYFSRFLLGQILWSGIFFIAGGLRYLLAWYAALFVFTFLLRDFNYRGHGGNFRSEKKPGWEFDVKSKALNQHFYGFISGEWHDNHHNYPMSANSGFLAHQIDIAYLLIRLMHKFGIVGSYIDMSERFKKKYNIRN